MQDWLVSTGVVALGEMGDKTQLLAMALAATYRRPWAIVAGILIATLANHAAAAALGAWVAQALGPTVLQWAVGLSFLAMAVWILIPDSLDDDAAAAEGRWGVLATTTVAFFIAEMGDKTQIATIALAARFDNTVAVVAGTTLGMMLANAPVVWLGDRLSHRLPMVWIHRVCAAIFAVLGLVTLLHAVTANGAS